jgi:hypothetical protein
VHRVHCQRTASAPRRARIRTMCGRVIIASVSGLLLLAGCTSSSSQTASVFGGLAGPPQEATAHAPTPVAAQSRPQPERGTCGSADQCKLMLKTMIDSPDRGWIGQKQSPDAYANGTRLFRLSRPAQATDLRGAVAGGRRARCGVEDAGGQRLGDVARPGHPDAGSVQPGRGRAQQGARGTLPYLTRSDGAA